MTQTDGLVRDGESREIHAKQGANMKACETIVTRAVILTTTLILMLFFPARSAAFVDQIPDGPFAVPPPLEQAPADALYVLQQFSYSRTVADVVFGHAVNSRGELQELRLEVWEPDGHDEAFRPVIVQAPGGGFTTLGGLTFMPYLLERGYVVVHVAQYRIRPELPTGFTAFLSPEGVMSIVTGEATDAAHDAQHDMQAAVRWVRANAHELRVDPTRIIAAGHSAGGIMAWATAYNYDDPGDSGQPGWHSHVAAAVVSAGAYMVGVQGVITPGKPPVIALHGTDDTTVPMALSIVPCLNAVAMGNICEHHVFPGAGHRHSSGFLREERARRAADFLWRHVLSAERIGTTFDDVAADGYGGTATVSGRLVTEDGEPLAGARVLAKAMAGWAETTTGDDGVFILDVDAPDDGSSTDVELRYHGHSEPSWLDGPPIAPTHATVTVN